MITHSIYYTCISLSFPSGIKTALNNLQDALLSIENGMPVDIINVDITNAYLRMCDVIGEGSPEDIINNLFANFCLGK